MLIKPMRVNKYFIRTPFILKYKFPPWKASLSTSKIKLLSKNFTYLKTIKFDKIITKRYTKKVAEKLKKAMIHKRSRSGSSIWLERRPVTAEVASSSLVRIAI